MEPRFYDAFAGIGGIRLGMERAGFRCAGSCEIDRAARATYAANFGGPPRDADIRTVRALPPNTRVLCGGFPCQAFSSLGVRKGFSDPRGALFFQLARLLDTSKPAAFLFENVKGLISHDRGRTFSTIMKTLDDLGYRTMWNVLNSSRFGLAQGRERVFIVGFRSGAAAAAFEFPRGRKPGKTIASIMERDAGSEHNVSKAVLVSYVRKLKQRGTGRGGRFLQALHMPDEISRTLVTDGDRILVIDGKTVRRLTPREWARLQGFPDSFRLPDSKTPAYKQIGNSVPVPVVAAIGRQMRKVMS